MNDIQHNGQHIVALCHAGLANRIKCLVSVMRIAEKTSRKLILYWPKDAALNCQFSDLFCNKIPEINEEELKVIRNQNSNENYSMIATWRLLPLPEDKISKNFAREIPSDMGNNIDLEYNRIPLSARKSLLVYINRLTPIKYIVKEVENFSRKFDHNTVSVNIRTWTWRTADNPARTMLFDVENVYKVLNKIDGHNFFVTCDNLEILQKLINKYGKRILYYPNRTRTISQNRVAEIQDALIELLLLAKNKSLKVSYLSTFSEMAWWFGGCESEVECIPPKKYLFKKFHTEKFNCYSLFWKWHIQPDHWPKSRRLLFIARRCIEESAEDLKDYLVRFWNSFFQ